jgi:hypothetical protein
VEQFSAGRRTLTTSECFDTYWRFAAERQRVFHARAAGLLPPWTGDPIIGRHKFTNVYRAADRVSQHLIREVIHTGPQDPEEVVFRTLLFKIFNKIETWELLVRELSQTPSWSRYEFAPYDHALSEAMRRGDRVYSAAYIIPNPPYGETRKHRNHLRLLEQAMTDDLPTALTKAGSLRAVYELLGSLPHSAQADRLPVPTEVACPRTGQHSSAPDEPRLAECGSVPSPTWPRPVRPLSEAAGRPSSSRLSAGSTGSSTTCG